MRFVALWYVFEGIVKLVTFLKIFFFLVQKKGVLLLSNSPVFFVI